MAKAAGLAKAQQRALDRLSEVQGIERFYLAGGAAIAWYLEHRRSRDLDLFSIDDHVDLDRLRRRLEMSPVNGEVITDSDVMMKVLVVGVPVDVVRYPHPPLFHPASGPNGFPIASLPDLAAMKVAAIARRGIYRDFWDLRAIAERDLPLADIFASYRKRFRIKERELYHVLRALTYFDDAERVRRFPAGLTRVKWEEIKGFFCNETPKLLGVDRG